MSQFVFPATNSPSQGDELSDLVELPTCPVCLERLDGSASGLMTTLCHHTFHCQCLSQWHDNSCPVCRFNQFVSTPPPSSQKALVDYVPEKWEVKCNSCSASKSNLWVCLICGHLGCGRYQKAHAFSHFSESGHFYAMELETQRVWDYDGDGYVHRLIQSKTDGKLVELPAAKSKDPFDLSCAKMDNLAVEFTNLLSSSLELQRRHFETALKSSFKTQRDMQNKLDTLDAKLAMTISDSCSLKEENDRLAQNIGNLEQEKQGLEASLSNTKRGFDKMTQRLKEVSRQLDEEACISRNMTTNQSAYTCQIKELEQEISAKDGEIVELKEQVRDLMVFLDARDRIQTLVNAEGLIAGSVSASSSSFARKKKSRK